MTFGIIVGIILIFVGAVMVYAVFMIFFPEWVGITGKTALDYERSHLEGSEQDQDDLIERIQTVSKREE